MKIGRVPASVKINSKKNTRPVQAITAEQDNEQFDILQKYLAGKDTISLRQLFNQSTKDMWIKKCDLSKFMAKTPEVKMSLNSPLESGLILMSLTRDRAFQLFNQTQHKMHGEDIEIVNKLSQLRIQEFRGSEDVTAAELHDASCEKFVSDYIKLIHYTSALPCIQSLSKDDVHMLIRNMFYVGFGMFCNKVYSRNDMHLTMPGGIVITKKISVFRYGAEVTERQFDFVARAKEMSDAEIALFLPFFMTHNIGKPVIFVLSFFFVIK
jgi:hypothetical protein